ncbi:carbohydrate-binding protein, partial [Nonomuraea sp. NPDC050556]|uniref:carbohydrate-binding protein n=1 Tax=Nonomuraea sp. NPDC050556 TaxID=3364369 RepID=UPI00378FCBBD
MRRSIPFVVLTVLASLFLTTAPTNASSASTTVMAAYPAWAPWTAYTAGTRVTYNGVDYECWQPHTSQPGWEPPNVPALWKNLGSSPGDTVKPTVPGNLRSTAQANTTIDLAWNASTDNSGTIKEYRVYEGTTVVKTVTGTSTQITGLSPNTSHTYTVTAVDPSNNESDKSASVTATTTNTGGDTVKPTVPGNLRSTAQANTTIDLAWNASTDNSGTIKEYRVYEG